MRDPLWKPCLEDYAKRLHALLPDALHGIYLYGSIVLDAFDPDTSDIDFMTVLKRRLTEAELDSLDALHAQLRAEHPLAARMDGTYQTLADMGKGNEELPPYPFHAMGAFHRAGAWDINNVTWWTIQHRAIALHGPAPASLGLQKDFANLRATMAYNLNVYWPHAAERLDAAHPDIAYHVSDGVLTLCRIFYTLAEQDIDSKTRAGQYALRHLPASRHRILREALRIRAGGAEPSLYATREELAQEARAFLQDMIQQCNSRYNLQT